MAHKGYWTVDLLVMQPGTEGVGGALIERCRESRRRRTDVEAVWTRRLRQGPKPATLRWDSSRILCAGRCSILRPAQPGTSSTAVGI